MIVAVALVHRGIVDIVQFEIFAVGTCVKGRFRIFSSDSAVPSLDGLLVCEKDLIGCDVACQVFAGYCYPRTCPWNRVLKNLLLDASSEVYSAASFSDHFLRFHFKSTWTQQLVNSFNRESSYILRCADFVHETSYNHTSSIR